MTHGAAAPTQGRRLAEHDRSLKHASGFMHTHTANMALMAGAGMLGRPGLYYRSSFSSAIGFDASMTNMHGCAYVLDGSWHV